LWERPAGVRDWRVPRGEVRAAIVAAAERWRVVEIAWDEWLWLDTAEELEDEGLPVLKFPQNITRLGPATARFYDMATQAGFTHSGHAGLARHVANATIKTDSRGSRLVKDSKNSPRKIDAAVAAVMALDRAAQVEPPRPVPQVFSMAELLAQVADEDARLARDEP